VILGHSPIQRLRLLGIAGIPCHRAEEEGQRGLDSVTGSAAIGAELLADVVNRLATDLVLEELEKRHGQLMVWGQSRVTSHE
jgi:hypothetical protein